MRERSDPERRLVLEHLPLVRLKLDPENARVHKPAQIKQIAASITAFNFNVPVLIDRDDKVLAGHGRVLACRKLGWTEIPVIRLEHLTPEQARAFAIADNRLTETSVWDEALLAGHLKVLSGLDLSFDLEATGFSIGEIDLKIAGLNIAIGNDDAPEAPLPDGPAITVFGDVWSLDDHRVVCGDSLEASTYAALMGDERAAMVFTDPPYNVPIDGHVSGKGKTTHREFAMATGEMSEAEFIGFLSTVCERMTAVSEPGALHYVCMDWGHSFELLSAGRASYDGLVNLCIWTKPNGGMGSLYRSQHELVFVFKAVGGAHRNNVQLGVFGRNRTNVWAYGAGASFGRGPEADLTSQHPTPKPVTMIADAILDVTKPRDLVLDVFLGSGSTLMAAESTGRICRGIEMDPLYVDLTIRRWQRQTGKAAVRLDGASFDAVSTEAVNINPEQEVAA
jgi:DNA modification methylase